MAATIAFDVYGTLIDPAGITVALRTHVGDQAEAVSADWRQKQVEYAFRRGLMDAYVSFDVCTAQALDYALAAHNLELADDQKQDLLAQYGRLPAFADAVAGLAALRADGHTLLTFSNGTMRSLQSLLAHSGLDIHLSDVVSVEAVQTFKPHPAVYQLLARRAGLPIGQVWLVSSNGWDVIGARAAGLRTVWLRRGPTAPFDPWGTPPERIASSLTELAAHFRQSP